MITQGNTPRSLTWPGCLAVVALGITFLPMLPSLHGEPLREDGEREELQDAKKDLEKAKADLERARADLDQKIKELIKAEQRRATESARKGLVQLEKAQPKPGQVVRNATYRIEITFSADENVDPNEVVRAIQKALPENLRNKGQPLHIRIAPSGVSGATLPSPPRPPLLAGPNFRPPTTPRGDTVKPLPKSSEKRINDLEKRLEKLLQELQELRKQMKQSRGGPAAPGAVPAGAAPIPEPVPSPPGVAPVPDLPPIPPAAPIPSAVTPIPPTENPTPPADPSARRRPNPYGEYRFVS